MRPGPQLSRYFSGLDYDQYPRQDSLFAKMNFQQTLLPTLSAIAIAASACATEFKYSAVEKVAQLDPPGKILSLKQLNSAIEKEPNNALNYVYRGNCYFRAGDAALAQKDFEKAARVNFRLGLAHLGLSRVAQTNQNWKHAIQELNIAILQGSPIDAALAKWDLSIIHRDMNDLPSSIQDIKEAASTKGLSPAMHVNMLIDEAGLQLKSKRYNDALATCAGALKQSPRVPRVYALKAQVFFAQSKFKQSLQSYTDAIDLYPRERTALQTNQLASLYKQRAVIYDCLHLPKLADRDRSLATQNQQSLFDLMPFRNN